MTPFNQKIRGVTLVEIAIVLVIIGLLLGGILKGQELINNAKVRALADRQNSLRVAWFAFLDRYQALPGDYVDAGKYITGAVDGGGDGVITQDESPIVFQHLAGAGFLRCSQCTLMTTATPSTDNSPQNSYGGVIAIFHDNDLYATRGASDSPAPDQARLQIHTGPRIPSNILTEVDRKIDDGVANTGDFIFNIFAPDEDQQPSAKECMGAPGDNNLVTADSRDWRLANADGGPIAENCGASLPL